MAKYYLTQRAGEHLRAIYMYSYRQWGARQADVYLQSIIACLQDIAVNPALRRVRRAGRRTCEWPFLMARVELHYAIYKQVDDGIIVAAVLHARRDIAGIIDQIGARLAAEIERIEQDMA